MAKAKVLSGSEPKRKQRPAITEEARENQLISMAYDRVAQRIEDGTATSQELCFFLKLGCTKEKVERDILEKQKKLLDAKTEQLESMTRVEELYSNALNAMRRYSGQSEEGPDTEEIEDEYDE